MKKIIALMLALLLLAGVASAAFTDDAAIGEDYTDAVAAMSDAKIIGGFPDGSFRPQETLTRAQAAKIICTMLLGADHVNDVSASATFADTNGHWAAKFIGYCADQGIVSGVGNNKFNPEGKLTGAAFAKMLLVAYGHDAEKEGFTGSNWIMNVQKALRADGMNYKTSAADSPMTRENACQMAYNFKVTADIDAVTGYTEETIRFTSSNVKLLGRAQLTDSGVVTTFSGDGIEFTLDCKGTLNVGYSTSAAQSILAFVDGKEFLPRAALTASGSTAAVCRFITPGVHTIRIIQDTEVNTSGKQITLTNLSVSCKADTMKATAAKNLYIEFIGDSITAGDYVSGTMAAPYHAASQSYGYYTAEKMDADYSIIAKGGIGFTTEKWINGVSPTEMYQYKDAWLNKTDLASHSRTPDVVVIGLGQNDARNDEQMHTNLTNFAKFVRQTVGAKAKIVMIYNMMSDKHAGIADQVAKELGTGFYAFEMPRGNNGVAATSTASRHPNGADNQKSADALSAFLKTIL